MKFNRETLEALQGSLELACESIEAILDVLPDNVDVEVTLDPFTHEVFCAEYHGERIPIVEIIPEVSALSASLEEIEAFQYAMESDAAEVFA